MGQRLAICAVVFGDALRMQRPQPGVRIASIDRDRRHGAESSAATGVTEESSSGEEDRCELHDEAPILLEIREGDLVIEPDCTPGNEIYKTDNGRLQYPPGNFQFRECSDTECMSCDAADVFFDFRGSLESPPALPNCGRLTAWARVGRNGCQWHDVIIQRPGEVLPVYLATNSRDPVPLAPASLDLADDQLCDAGQCSGADPGQHALVVFGQTFTVADSPVMLDVDFAGGSITLPYEFINRMASISSSCQEQVAWTARRLLQD